MRKLAQRGPRQQGGADTARNARGGDRGKSESRSSGSQAGTVAAFQELMDRSPRVQTQMRLGEALQRRSLALTTGTKPVVQRLKTASQFGLDESSQGDLIALINGFHEMRRKVGNGPYNSNNITDDLEDRLMGIMQKAELYGLNAVAEDASTELSYLSQNGSLREPEPDSLSSNILTISGSSNQEQIVISPSVSVETDDKEIQAKLEGPLRLYKRIVSILQRGVLPPSSLDKSDYKGSSDIQVSEQATDKVSYFDIDIGRDPKGRYDERFPKPGHSSVSVALEREHDLIEIGKEALDLARTGNDEALAAVRQVQGLTKLKDAPVNDFMAKMIGSQRALWDLGNIVRGSAGPLFRSMLARRAANTAVVVSAGERRQSAELVRKEWTAKQGFGPDARELRVPVGLEPEAISYVILPAYMKIFRDSLESSFKVEFIFAGDTEIDIGYFDAETGSVPPVRIPVPNYQAVIEDLISRGDKKMITHITRV